MAIAFYMDEHVRRVITVQLRIRGVDVLTVQEDERTGFPDSIILDRAAELERTPAKSKIIAEDSFAT